MDKKDWARWLREVYTVKRDEQEPCAICHKYELITHAHHLIPVSEMAGLLEMLNKEPSEIGDFDVVYIWLCPNHHALWHLMHSKNAAKRMEAHRQLDEAERASYNQLNRLTTQTWGEFSKFIRGV